MKIDELNVQNPWWKFGTEFANYDKQLKELKKKLIKFKREKILLKKGELYIVRGVRQSGKTTYLKQLIKEKIINKEVLPEAILYISCDRLFSRKELHNIITDYFKLNRELEHLIIFLDEITYLGEWELELKVLADSNFMDKITILATGSNPVEVKEKTERLPGRVKSEYYFKPFTFREFVSQSVSSLLQRIPDQEFKHSLINLRNTIGSLNYPYNILEESFQLIIEKINKILPFKEELDYLFDIYLLTGGFPYTINNYLENRYQNKKENIDNNLYEIIIRTVLGDISKTKRSEALAREIMKYILEKYGSRYSFTTIAKGVDSSHQVIQDYLEVLENSFLVQVIYALDITKRQMKFKGDKKIYFSDPFIYHALHSHLVGETGFELSKKSISKRKEKIIEGVVANHLIRTKEIPYQREWKTYLWYLYTTTGKEIDFVYKKNNGSLLGIELKYQYEMSLKEVAAPQEIKNQLILTKNQFQLTQNLLLIPVSLFIFLLQNSSRVL